MNKAFLVLLSEKGISKFREIFGNEDVVFIEASAINGENEAYSVLILPPVKDLQGNTEESNEELSELESVPKDLI